jgi:hypothetical protein
MKNKITLLAICIFALSQNIVAQDNPFRIGFKFGVPQLAGFNFEYVTPALENRLSIDADISYIPIQNIKYTYLGLGANYYIFDEGDGLYCGINFNQLLLSADIDLKSSLGNSTNVVAKASANLLGFKIGGKHGDQFYFRWNLGYGIGIGAPVLEANGIIDGEKVSAREDLPISIEGVMGDIGFGFAF